MPLPGAFPAIEAIAASCSTEAPPPATLGDSPCINPSNDDAVIWTPHPHLCQDPNPCTATRMRRQHGATGPRRTSLPCPLRLASSSVPALPVDPMRENPARLLWMKVASGAPTAALFRFNTRAPSLFCCRLEA
eukprot:1742839-Rhodomonas_salina.1